MVLTLIIASKAPATTGGLTQSVVIARLKCVVNEGVIQNLIADLGPIARDRQKFTQRIAFHWLQADSADVRRLIEVLIVVRVKVYLYKVLS